MNANDSGTPPPSKTASSRRRGRGEGGVGRRRDGTWYATVSLGVGTDGKRLRKYFYGVSKTAVTKERTEWLAAQAAGTAAYDPARETVAQYLQAWLESIAPNRRTNTNLYYRYNVEHLIVPEGGVLRDVALGKLTAAHLDRWVAEMETKGRDPRARKRAYVVLKTALKKAVKQRRVVDPFADHEAPRAAKATMTTWTEEEARTFLAAAAKDRYFALWFLALTTGMRQGELLGLQWSDVHLPPAPATEGGTLRVQHQLLQARGTMIGLAPPKTAAAVRTVRLAPEAVVVLRRHRAAALEHGTVASSYVFHNRTGGPLFKNNVQERFYNLIKKAGVRRVRFHDLRHTAASTAIKAGVPVKVVSELLGHSDVSTTLRTYVHTDAAQHEAAVAALGAAFGAKSEVK